MGYQIEYTPTTGDQGIDIICRKNGQRIGVQAKRFSKNVSNSAVQEALGGKIFYQLDEVYVVTNSAFTKSARDLADRTKINLIDREGLKKLIKENM
jgi:restriction system protein